MADKKGLIVLGAVLLGTLGFALSRKTQAAPPPPPAPAPEQNIGNLFGVVRSDGTPLSGVSIKLLETGMPSPPEPTATFFFNCNQVAAGV